MEASREEYSTILLRKLKWKMCWKSLNSTQGEKLENSWKENHQDKFQQIMYFLWIQNLSTHESHRLQLSGQYSYKRIENTQGK